MEVLFEYRGSRRPLTIASGDSITQCVSNELRLVGRSGARVVTADTNLSTEREGGRVYLLQRWSSQWACYVDVNNALEIRDGDKLAVIAKPKPPSKFLMLCCGCCSDSASETTSNVKGVPKNKQKRVRKNEEIQSLDYKFAVESEANSDWESQSVTDNTQQQDASIDDGKQGYVRGPTGRASWKLVPTTNSDKQTDTQSQSDTENEQHQTVDNIPPGNNIQQQVNDDEDTNSVPLANNDSPDIMPVEEIGAQPESDEHRGSDSEGMIQQVDTADDMNTVQDSTSIQKTAEQSQPTPSDNDSEHGNS